MELLYTCDAYQQQPKHVAQAFARSYWSQPRRIKRWKEGTHTFEMIGGTGRVYEVRLVQRPHDYDVYAVVVLQP